MMWTILISSSGELVIYRLCMRCTLHVSMNRNTTNWYWVVHRKGYRNDGIASFRYLFHSLLSPILPATAWNWLTLLGLAWELYFGNTAYQSNYGENEMYQVPQYKLLFGGLNFFLQIARLELGIRTVLKSLFFTV